MLVLLLSATHALAAPQSTATVLAVTAGGNPVTTVAPKTVVTLTATVTSAGTPVAPGTVNFCDTAGALCTDIHLVGTAQLTSAGTATIRFRPGMGTHSYKAVFVGTQSYTGSSSAASSISIPQTITINLTATGSAGGYGVSQSVVIPAKLTPTGTVALQDITNNNYVLGSAALTLQSTTQSPNTVASLSTTGGSLVAPIVAGDLNQDGIPDLIVPNGNVQIFLGNGDGTFTAAATIPDSSNAVAVAIGDFNSDGKPDLAVVNSNSTTLTILLGNGDGTFNAVPATPATGNGASRIAVGDWNDDGQLDLAVTNITDNTITVLLGNGDGTFTPGTTVATPNSPYDITAADFNADGQLDLAISNTYYASGCLNVFLGKGDGTFKSTPSLINGTNSCYAVAAVDVNNDGKLDLLGSDFDNNWIVVLTGNGTGSFNFLSNVRLPSFSAPDSLAIGDLNGDGIADFATSSDMGSTSGYGFSIATGNGNGTFQLFPISGTGTSFKGAAVADFTGDGLADIAVRADSTEIYASSVSETFTNLYKNVSPAGSGTHQIQAVYAGDATYAPATSNILNLTAVPAPTSVSLTATPSGGSTYGQQVVLSATLAPYNSQGHATDGETVTFSNGSTALGPAVLSNGVASINVTSLPLGSNSLAVAYGGDADFAASTSPALSYGVTYATTLGLSVSSSSVAFGQPITLTAQLSPFTMSPQTTDGETVTFYNGSIKLGTAPLSSGVATLALPAGSPATEHITASYSGDTYFGSATSSAVSVTITRATPTVTWTPPGSLVYTGKPIGSSLYTASSTTPGYFVYTATPSAGPAFTLYSITTLPAGSYKLTATLTPTDYTDYTTGSTSVTLLVAPAPLTVVPQNLSRAYGAANPALPGSVTGALNADTFVVTGATTATTSSSVGAYPITYTVSGNNLGNYAVTQATGTLTVTRATPALTWNAPGSITYGTALSAAQLNATASTPGAFTYTPALGAVLPAGAQKLSVTFTPTDTANFSSQNATVTLPVNPAAIAITANSFARVYGTANPTFTGTVLGAVNGDTFTESFSTTAGPGSIVGSYPIVPAVSGTNAANYAIAATNGSLTISQAGTATTFALSNSNLTLTANVASLTSGTPSGTVSFYEGQTLVGTGTLTNGVASFTTASFPSGDVVVTAQYSGDANFTQSSSAPILVLTVQPAQTQLTVTSVGSVSDTLNLTSASGFSGTVQFSCSGLPQNAACSFAPPSVTFGSSSSASTTLTIQTGTSVSMAHSGPLSGRSLTALAMMLCIPGMWLSPLALRRRLPRLAAMIVFALLAASACTSLIGCGSNPITTPAGTSTVHVMATGPSGFQQTTDLTVTIQ